MVKIASLLSRTIKLKKNRKRKRGDGTDLFEVRPTQDKNGVGIFAVDKIDCGDLIISHEDPIVACSAHPDPHICNSCAAPIGTLGKDHLKANDIDVSLPFIFDGTDSDDLVFTTSHMKCRECEDAVYCSKECFQKRQEQHSIFCKASAPLKDFFEKEEGNATILRLATKVIAVAMSHFSSLSKDKQISIEQCFWWTEYGSHPLWWEVGSSVDDKKDITNRFCTVLQTSLLESIALKNVNLQENFIRQICSLDNIGSILGMLQCNVMEYEFPSPAAQYMEQVMEDARDEQFAAAEQPISGSGLYPLLSLANHDCNPNASIEFLQESNRGSMVATREISPGEEICITYVCNGGVGGDGAEYFRHFSPTRTWKWLNDKLNNEEDDEVEDEELDSDLHDDSKSVDESCASSNNENPLEQEKDSDNESLLEGSTVEERAKSLLEYGFHCKCNRCITQRGDDTKQT